MIQANTKKRYFVKAPTSGWHEVGEDGYHAYIRFLKATANPTAITMDELIKFRTRIEEVKQ